MSDFEISPPSDKNETAKAVEAKVRMSLSEAETEGLDIKFLSLGSSPGVLTSSLIYWVNQVGERHSGKLLAYFQDDALAKALGKHNSLQLKPLHETIKIPDFREVLIVGGNVALFDANGKIFIQRGKEFVDSANRVIRTLSKITALIDARNK